MYSKTLLIFLVVYFLSGSSHGQRAKKFFRKDYSYIEAAESFYKIHTVPQTWHEAKRVCAQEGATFWHPDNDDEAKAVIAFWKATRDKIGWMYVGSSDLMGQGMFETIGGKLLSEVYHNWQSGQPDNYYGNDDCVFIYKEGVLGDYPCHHKSPFICKKSLQSLQWNYGCDMPYTDYTKNDYTGKCYKLHTTPLTWTEAYAVCRREQSYLAVINNQREADYLANLTESTPKPRVKENYQRGIYHVGFHNKFNEGWQTVQGEPMHVDAEAWWDNYQPDDRDQCGSMFYTGLLINSDCNNTKSFFICERNVENSTSTELEDVMKHRIPKLLIP